MGLEFRFSRKFPQFLTRNRDGELCAGTLSYAYPEVIDFKLNIMREILDYGFDGIGINMHKGGDHRIPRWDEQGVFYAHYDPPLIEAFKEATSRDPYKIPNDDLEWLRFRSQPVSEFMRRASHMVRTEYPGVEFGAFGVSAGMQLPTGHWFSKGDHHPSAPARPALEANLEDHRVWTSEGLIDFLIAEAVGDYSWDKIFPEFKQEIRDPNCRLGVWQITWGRADQAANDARLALRAGSREIHYFAYEPFLPRGLHPYTYPDSRPVLREACELVRRCRTCG